MAELAARWGFEADSPRLRVALTHRSAAAGIAGSNERLEFLGDALLSAFVARFLLDALPPNADEGTLSRARAQIVRRETLANTARALGLPDLLIVGPGERKEQRHTHDGPLADAFEALIGALFLDKGAQAAEQFVHAALAPTLALVASAPPAPDPKTRLQERLQAQSRGLPTYEVVAHEGAGHRHRFIAEARVGGTILGRGEGETKRAAQTAAALTALQELGAPPAAAVPSTPPPRLPSLPPRPPSLGGEDSAGRNAPAERTLPAGRVVGAGQTQASHQIQSSPPKLGGRGGELDGSSGENTTECTT